MNHTNFKILSKLSLFSFFIGIFMIYSSCGEISLGSSVNDGIPSGDRIKSGTLSTYSGTVSVYKTVSGPATLRFENLSGPTSTLLYVWATVDGSETTISTTLKGTSGNMNFSTSITSSNWTSVRISESFSPFTTIATAPLF
ncbi:MAG: hypothetical protein CL678_11425 [Bdellovibrionaceae bacterium]|nr:hypothetical protein [Pseudobdellovibrionaceae bacterium]|tara:strand:- start:3265 stop:3687 length:423 start_codon:yes stop_codon:yes gene_type:complete